MAEILVFEPFAAFKRIDRQCNDFLTVNDINNFFLSNNVNMNIDEVSAVFNLMDANKDGKILFEEYIIYINYCIISNSFYYYFTISLRKNFLLFLIIIK